MAHLIPTLGQASTYRDRKYPEGPEQLEIDLENSSTLYVGNLSFFTTEEQIYEVFSATGEIKRIIMGLDRNKKTPCGFCFVEYYVREDALDAQKFINGTKVDERIVRTDVDPGFKPSRQYGRGKTGGQVRDEYRNDYDEGRGGWGVRIREEEEREALTRDVYDGTNTMVPAGNYEYGYSQSNTKRDRSDDEDDYPHHYSKGRKY